MIQRNKPYRKKCSVTFCVAACLLETQTTRRRSPVLTCRSYSNKLRGKNIQYFDM